MPESSRGREGEGKAILGPLQSCDLRPDDVFCCFQQAPFLKERGQDFPPRQSQIWQSQGSKRPQPFVSLKFHLYCVPFSP